MSLGYDIIYTAGLLVSSPVWAFGLWRSGKWRSDWPARFGRVRDFPDKTRGQRTVLIHAVSVGEVNAAAGLVAELRERRPDLRIVVSVTTDTGIARAAALFAGKHEVVRYPLDLGWSVRRFLDVVKPNLVGLIELEVWPNFVRECVKRSVPVCVLNGRLSARSFSRYRLVRTLVRPTFARLALAAVQTQDYADRFVALGTPTQRVTVADSLKWDGTKIVPPEAVAGVTELAEAIGLDRSRPIIVAGSTGPGEEKLLIDTCPPEAQLVLVPRRPERFDEVAAIAPMVRRSHYADGSKRPKDDTRLFLLDSMGELNKAYALADVAIVGRSFRGLHGSNPIEPIALGKPTIIGPDHSDFSDMVAALAGAEGIMVTRDPGAAAADLLSNPQKARDLAQRGLQVIRSRQGVTAQQAKLFLDVLDRGR